MKNNVKFKLFLEKVLFSSTKVLMGILSMLIFATCIYVLLFNGQYILSVLLFLIASVLAGIVLVLVDLDDYKNQVKTFNDLFIKIGLKKEDNL